MVQILPAVPRPLSFSSELAQVLGQTIGDVGTAYFQNQKHRQIQEQDERYMQLLQDPELTQMQKLNIASKLSPERQKAVMDYMKEQEKMAGKATLLQQLGIVPSQMNQPMQAPNMGQQQAPAASAGQEGGPAQAPQTSQYNPLSIEDKDIAALAAVDPNLAKTIQGQKNAALEQRRFEEREEKEERRFTEKQRLQIHRDLASVSEGINEDAKTAHKRLHAFDRMEELLDKGNLNPTNLQNFMANAFKGTTLEGLLSSDDRAEFQAASLMGYEGMKDMFGVRLSDADLKLASGKVPSPEKSPEANKAIINFWRFFDKMAVEKAKVAKQVVKENGGFRPIDFEDQVNERLEKQFAREAERVTKAAAQAGESRPSREEKRIETKLDQAREMIKGDTLQPGHVWIVDPQGVPREVPISSLKAVQAAGGVLLQ